MPCSPFTLPENTICYPLADHRSKCPINFIKFYESDDISPPPNMSYSVLNAFARASLTDKFYVMVTSNQGTELPFIETKLEYRPCMLPS